jgi:hypothetical protein
VAENEVEKSLWQDMTFSRAERTESGSIPLCRRPARSEVKAARKSGIFSSLRLRLRQVPHASVFEGAFGFGSCSKQIVTAKN